MSVALSLIIVTYLVTIGVGLVIGGPRLAKKTHQFWLRVIARVLKSLLNLLGSGLKALANKIRP